MLRPKYICPICQNEDHPAAARFCKICGAAIPIGPMPAISLWQPWASLLACGAKRYETRSWHTSYRGQIAIHAAKKPFDTDSYLDGELYQFAKALNLPDIYSFDKLPRGCVIALAELVECWEITANGHTNGSDKAAHIVGGVYGGKANIVEGREILFGDWTPGRYAWEFANMTMLPEPIPTKGMQRIWNWEGIKPCETTAPSQPQS